MGLGIICDVIILVAAVLVAITNIYTFFKKSGKGIKKKVEEVKAGQEAEFNKKIDERLQSVLPDILLKHDLETREKYRADREKYLQEIKAEVIKEISTQLSAVEKIQIDIEALAESAKDVLREKIMALYHKNKKIRQLEEHEGEALQQYYRDYKAIGGNSYIDKYYTRMKAWQVIPDDYDDDIK